MLRLQLGHRAVRCLLAGAAEDDGGAVLQIFFYDGVPDAAGAAGDDGDLVVEHGGFLLFYW